MPGDVDHDRRRFLGGAAMTLAASHLGALGAALQRLVGASDAPPVTNDASSELSSLGGATTWLNSPPLAAGELRGKVVLVNFCTYTCINWLRSLPYVRAWAERYRERGLVVIGAHTPEFSFERDLDNVRRALKEMRVAYPVAVDNEYAIWRGFSNNYWPAVYVLDGRGRVRHRHFGEGDYDKTEGAIRQLLGEAGVGALDRAAAVPADARGAEVAADWGSLKSPETYVGYERGERFASPGGAAADERRAYAVPPRLALNRWALAGDWTLGAEAAVLNGATGRIAYRFHARDVHLVMGPEKRGTSVRFRVRVDGQPPGAARGGDVDAAGNGTLADQRLYQLVRQPGPIVDRLFEIEFLGPDAEAYAFTFG